MNRSLLLITTAAAFMGLVGCQIARPGAGCAHVQATPPAEAPVVTSSSFEIEVSDDMDYEASGWLRVGGGADVVSPAPANVPADESGVQSGAELHADPIPQDVTIPSSSFEVEVSDGMDYEAHGWVQVGGGARIAREPVQPGCPPRDRGFQWDEGGREGWGKRWSDRPATERRDYYMRTEDGRVVSSPNMECEEVDGWTRCWSID